MNFRQYLFNYIEEYEQVNHDDVMKLGVDKGLSHKEILDSVNDLVKNFKIKAVNDGGVIKFCKFIITPLPGGIKLKREEREVYDFLEACGEKGAGVQDIIINLKKKRKEASNLLNDLCNIKLVMKNPANRVCYVYFSLIFFFF
jgi:hypothetical protein